MKNVWIYVCRTALSWLPRFGSIPDFACRCPKSLYSAGLHVHRKSQVKFNHLRTVYTASHRSQGKRSSNFLFSTTSMQGNGLPSAISQRPGDPMLPTPQHAQPHLSINGACSLELHSMAEGKRQRRADRYGHRVTTPSGDVV
jgi:hypothetical protein